jgi:hypothetical protein
MQRLTISLAILLPFAAQAPGSAPDRAVATATSSAPSTAERAQPVNIGAPRSASVPGELGATFDNALLISVDGLRSDALIAGPADDLPNFQRLRRGASTLNARTDPDWTVTLPNHTAMITGRFVEGETGHAWTKNDEADRGETLHKNKGAYIAGIFDVAHDRGFFTGLYAGKKKFAIYDESWDELSGAPDTTGPDDGKRKIDQWDFRDKSADLADDVITALTTKTKRKLLFVHFAVTDLTGHAYGWDLTKGSRYSKAVAEVDRELGRILDAIEQTESLRGKTAIVLTADHGGGAPFRSHDQPHMWVDYIIPFVVWTSREDTPRDLYAINAATRRDPGLSRPRRDDAGLPPIRNGDAGNLVLTLLGLPAIPGSTIDAKQDLSVAAPTPAVSAGPAKAASR